MTYTLDLLTALEEAVSPSLLDRMEREGLTEVELPVDYDYTPPTRGRLWGENPCPDDPGECTWHIENAGHQVLMAVCEKFGRDIGPKQVRCIISAVEAYVSTLDLREEIAEDARIAKESHEADWRYECERNERLASL